MSSKHDKKKSKHQASSGTGVDALLDAFSNSKNASMAAKTAEWEQKGDAGVVGDDVSRRAHDENHRAGVRLISCR